MSVGHFSTGSSITIKSVKPDTETVQPINFEPYNWLKNAKIYNKRWLRVPNDWIFENADIIVLLFTAKGVDRGGILKEFYHIYESTKYVHIPIEVIFLPMDETEDDALACFKEQANWFTLRFNDVLIHTLKFMYGITCIPHLMVFNTNCEVISYNGIADLDMYGKNAVISWSTLLSTTKKQRRRSEDAQFYGPVWRFVKPEEKIDKYEYHRRFKVDGEPVEDHTHFPGHSHLSVSHNEPTDALLNMLESSPTKPSKDRFKPPEDQEAPIKFSDGQEGRSKPVTHADVLGSRKSSIIHIKLPEDTSKTPLSHEQFPERSKSAVSGHSMPSESHVQMSEGGSKQSKNRVQLPDDSKDSESRVQFPENRSKLATGQTSENNTQLPETRSKTTKSAKFMD